MQTCSYTDACPGSVVDGWWALVAAEVIGLDTSVYLRKRRSVLYIDSQTNTLLLLNLDKHSVGFTIKEHAA